MFVISFSPQVTSWLPTFAVRGDIIYINDFLEYDFSSLPEGATLPAEAISDTDYFRGDIERRNGAIYLTLCLPCTVYASVGRRFPVAQSVQSDTQQAEIILPLDLGEVQMGFRDMTVAEWLRHVGSVLTQYGKDGVDCGDVLKNMCYAIQTLDFGEDEDAAAELHEILDRLFEVFGWPQPAEAPAATTGNIRGVLQKIAAWFAG